MVVNKKSNGKNRVEFVSYTGRYPNLCSGTLTVKIDGEEVKFGHDAGVYVEFVNGKSADGHYPKFWSSGGSVSHDGHYDNWEIKNEEWEIDVNYLDEKFWDVANELDEIINENIEWGCCGGCI